MFDTVEVNSTFYRLPTAKACKTWALRRHPPVSRFQSKQVDTSTHVKRLKDLEQGVERLYESLDPLVQSGKLGPILWQLPATFGRDDERLTAALAALPSGRHAFEFRHASWYADQVYELLEGHGAALVIADHPSRTLPAAPFTAPWSYVRLHFGRRGRSGNYSHTEIREWESLIGSWERESWVYFNNDWEAFAPANARELRRLLASHAAAR